MSTNEPLPIALPSDLANRLAMYLGVANRVVTVAECGGIAPDRRTAYRQSRDNLAPIVERVSRWLAAHPTTDGTIPNGEIVVLGSVPVWDGVSQFVTVDCDTVLDLGD